MLRLFLGLLPVEGEVALAATSATEGPCAGTEELPRHHSAVIPLFRYSDPSNINSLAS